MKKRVLRFVTISCAVTLLLIGLNVSAQEETKSVTKLDTVVVTASKKGATLLNTPAAISIITAEDIEKSGQRDLAAIISSVPGVINQSTAKGKTYFSFRGTKSPHVGAPIVLVDGKPYNFGVCGFNNLGNIPVERIKRIEIIKSPPASIYGANSSRGVINIITKTGEYAQKPLNFTAKTEIGSWNTLENSLSVYGKLDKWDYNLSGSCDESDGYRHTDPERESLSGQLGYEFDEGVRLEGDVNWSEYSLKSYMSMKDWQLKKYRKDIRDIPNKRRESVSGYTYRPNESDKELLNGGLKFSYDKDNWLFNSSFSMSHFDYIYENLKYYNKLSGTYSRYNKCCKYDKNDDKIDFKISGGHTFSDEDKLTDTIILGYDFSKDTFSQTKSYPYAITLSSDQKNDIKKENINCVKNIHGVFANNEFKYGKWGLLTGLRYDIANYDVENEVPQSVKNEFKELGWNIAPSYSFTPNSNLFFSVNKSYWYPAPAYIKSALEKNSPDNKVENLGPEEDLTYELGFKHRLMKAFNYSVGIFQTKTEHKYMYFYDDAGDFQGWKPVGDSIHRGVEVEADGRPLEWFGYRLAFSRLDAEWDSGKERVAIHSEVPTKNYEYVDVKGKKLYDVPEYTCSVGVDFYALKNWQLSVSLNGVGERYIDAMNHYKETAYSTVDAKLSYTLKNWKLYLLSSNLFDQESEKLYNSTGKRDADGEPSNSYYPRDGRYIGLGATVKF